MSGVRDDLRSVWSDVVWIDEAGRLVIPPDVLRRMGWAEGQRLDLSVDTTGQVTLSVARS